jgi:pimeloyl-ACP methyl ester carboxylesterase
VRHQPERAKDWAGSGANDYVPGEVQGEATMARAARHPGLHDASGAVLHGQLLDVAGCETYVVDAGEGPPVLLLHGFADTADCWRRVVPGLLRRHRVIAIDIPPFARSGRPNLRNGDALVDWYPEFFPALLAELELERLAIAGHSLGGAIALSLALQEPAAVDRLVLIAPAGLGDRAPWWWHAAAGRPVNWAAFLRLPNPLAGRAIRTGLRSFLEERLMHDVRRLEDVIDHFVDLHGGRRQLEGLLAAGRSLIPGYDGTLIRRAGELDCPVTVVWGREDRLAPVGHAAAFEAAVPHATVHVLDECGHYPQIERPALVGELLEDALAYESSERRRASSRATLSRNSSSVSSGAPRLRR